MISIKKSVTALSLFVFSLLLSFTAAAEDYTEIFSEANHLYEAGQYEDALLKYDSIQKGGYESAALYYNMGNSLYRLDRRAEAILYYEKALRLEPHHADALVNLEYVRQFNADKIEDVPEFVMLSWLRDFRLLLSADAWAWISLLLLAICAALLLGYFYGRSRGVRKSSFVCMLVAGVFTLIAMSFSLVQASYVENDDAAIVMEEVSSVRGAPDSGAKGLFVLHEGTKVEVIERNGGWSRIELSDGRQGWISSAEIEKI